MGSKAGFQVVLGLVYVAIALGLFIVAVEVFHVDISRLKEWGF